MANERLAWVDVLKCLGMVAIFLGHFGQNAGYFYLYVFSYHVPLFFFAAGFFAVPKKQTRIKAYIVKKIRTIMLPYGVFAFLQVTLFAIQGNLPPSQVLQYLYEHFLGVRNTSVGGLWFLPCVFVMSIVYYILHCIIKNKYILLLIALVFFYWGQAANHPSWAFNIDSMLYYMFYYSLGAVCFPWLNKLSARKKSPVHVVSMLVCFIAVALISATIFYQRQDYLFSFMTMPFFSAIHMDYFMYPILGITLNLGLSFALENIQFLSKLGQSTLYLCGNENNAKMLVSAAVVLFGGGSILSVSSCGIYLCGHIIHVHILFPNASGSSHISFPESSKASFFVGEGKESGSDFSKPIPSRLDIFCRICYYY